VLVREAHETIGGGARSAALTLPGFVHDVCSAIHPLGAGSPFFRILPLAEHGLEWIQPPAALAHPFDDGTAAVLERAVVATSETLGQDAAAYCRLMAPFVTSWDKLATTVLGPLQWPRHPLALLRFGWCAWRSACGLAERVFTGERARAFFGGLAAHAIMPLEWVPTAAFGLVLGILGHAIGWPLPRGGSQQITNALARYFQTLGGEIVTHAPVHSIDDLPPTRVVLCDVTPRQLLRLAAHRLPASYCHQLARYRYGPGRPRHAHGLEPCTWVAHWPKSPLPSVPHGTGNMLTDRLCWWRSRACLMPHAPRPGNIPSGPTATSPMARQPI
jgi:phytoene dehydrogenase-like protein